jgi:NADH-quinone oxidoreductase subunit G
VRVLAQDRLSPLYEITHQQTRLHDVQEAGVNLAPEDIALFGLAVATTLDTGLVPSDTAHSALVTRVATSLKNSKKPLIVSGSGAQSIAVVEAAAAIAQALDKPETLLSYCVPESNSLGVALSGSGTELSISDLCEKASSNKVDTLIVLENDLFRRAPRAAIEQLFSNVTNLVVLDYIDTETISQSAMALPSASFAEAEGTLISSEGRAQRHYPVFLPAEQRQTAWNWIQQIAVASGKSGFDGFEHFDAITQAVAKASPALERIVEASPAADYRSRGVKIPRQTHRASGRTAIRANISVHEPKQPVDQETPFAFTMEGSTGKQAGALIPFVWSPGWNSNQSVHKFQSKPGGALRGGTPGTRIIGNTKTVNKVTSEPQQPFASNPNAWRLLPVYKIFGSEETSARSAAIQELTIMPFVQISANDANKLGVGAGDLLEFDLEADSQQSETQQVETHIDDSLPDGCAGYGVGLPGAAWLPPIQQVRLRKASQVSAQDAKEASDV